MKLTNATLRPNGRFYFDDDKPEEGWVELQLLNGEDLDEIIKAVSTKQTPEYKRGVRYPREPKIDEVKQAEMMWDKMITAWDNIEVNGKLLLCDYESKAFMMRQSVTFARRVAEGLEALTADANAGAKERGDSEAKN